MSFEKNENVVFKNYSVVKPLGRGAYGSVFEMYDSENGERFALKEVPISSDNVHNFLAEILPDCVVCHESIQKYYPFVISRRPAILENYANVSVCKEHKQIEDDVHLVNSNDLPFMLTDIDNSKKPKVVKMTNRIIFEDVEVGNTSQGDKKRINKLTSGSSWSLGKKVKRSIASTSKKFYMYLKTNICDFSLRDFIDFRNHFLFRMIDEQTNISFDGNLDNQVQIPLDFYKDSIQEDKKVNKKFSLGIFRYILLGLIHLHSFGIAHNDIKSSNILLDSSESFRPKIADFGLKTFCKYSHGPKDNPDNSYNPDNLYDYCSNISVCTHFNQSKVDDCRALVYILYELLYPCRTQSEMLYLLKDLKRLKKVPNEFRVLYYEESLLIERVLTDDGITASSILTMLDDIS